MIASDVIFRASRLFPGVSRRMLRHYLRSGLPIPDRVRWLVNQLRWELAPRGPDVVAELGGGCALFVNLSSFIGIKIYFHGSSDIELARFLGRVLRPGDTYIDAGSHVGEFAVRASRLIGPSGRVVAVEASPEIVGRLEENVRLNGVSNVAVVHAAVCGDDRVCAFHIDPGVESGSSSIYRGGSPAARTVSVPGVRLDSLIARAGIERADLVKLDVEGAEFVALRDGARELLTSDRFRPVIVFEYNREVAGRAGWNLTSMVELFDQYEYLIGPMGAPVGGVLGRDDPEAGVPDFANLVAVPAGKSSQWRRG